MSLQLSDNNLELIFKDLEVVEKHLTEMKKKTKTGATKEDLKKIAVKRPRYLK